ncbi:MULTISPECIES: alpha/beta hydrolase [unclassified Sphingomonas]|uniref:alpha/beta hydrolase n=1 Tax=unclassified Sphingomonas TaxID=196159 RepID=UPI0026C7F1F4
MRWKILAPLVAMLLGLSAMIPDTPSLLSWPDLTSRPRPQADATISYGADAYQKVDLWLPKGAGKHPVVLMVHGGCWQTAIADRTLMNWIAADLRGRGIAVWNIDYRGVDRPGGGYPGTFQDAAAAADALATNAARYRLDTSRVVAVGHSAGGHLALWLAGRAKLPVNSLLRARNPLKIAHVVSLGGLPDLEATAASPDNGCGTEIVAKLTGPKSASRPDVFADTSVPRLLPIGVPQELVNGDNDRIIPMRLGTGYRQQATKAGDQATLHRIANTGHVELIAPETAAWGKARSLIEAAFK